MVRRSSAVAVGGGADSTRRFFLAVEHRQGVVVERRRHDDLGEHRRQRLGQRRGHRPVDGDDAAEGRDRVALVGRARRRR